MKRWLCRVLAAVSLFSAVLVGALWVRSYYVADFFDLSTPGGTAGSNTYRLASVRGTLLGACMCPVGEGDWTFTHERWALDNIIDRLNRDSAFGFFLDDRQGEVDRGGWAPHWFAELLSLSLGIPRLVSWRRAARARRRIEAGRCVRCGYDLRATPDRCPECGATVSTCGALRG